ncbi:transcription factor ICE1-like [Phragmites australis]|uniref:transcription factor ICE1-like n=1 Tax=Phragmites australis TaxID=29695 RepID=UPI002D78906F|nr:transcription factor ICE1-like [Phragmites australis]
MGSSKCGRASTPRERSDGEEEDDDESTRERKSSRWRASAGGGGGFRGAGQERDRRRRGLGSLSSREHREMGRNAGEEEDDKKRKAAAVTVGVSSGAGDTVLDDADDDGVSIDASGMNCDSEDTRGIEESSKKDDKDSNANSMVTGGGVGDRPAKNLMAERRRRKKLNGQIYMLRSIVPKISR